MENSRRLSVTGAAAVCILYTVLRVWGLADSCLWFDEIFSIHAAEHDWAGLFSFVAQDLIHPPLFYVLLKLWITLGGENLYWLRLLPVLFAVLSLAPFYLLCRELKLRTPAISVALLLLAVNGALIKYSQEIRMYSLLLFISLVSIWLFSRFFYRGKNIWLLSLVNILLVYTHYFGWFVIAAELSAIFVFQRIKIRHVLIMLGIDLVAFVPWLWAVWDAARSGADVAQNIGWIEAPGFRSIFDLVLDLVEPIYFQQSSTDASSHLFITLPLLLIAAGAAIIYAAGSKDRDDGKALVLMLVLSLVPVLSAFVLSWLFPVSIWGSRHLIIVFAPVSIAFALLLTDIEAKAIRYALLGSVFVAATAAFVIKVRTPKPEFIWCAWEKAAPQITANGTRELYVFEDLTAYHLWFATRDLPAAPRIFKVVGIDGVVEDKAYFLPRGFDDVARVNVDEINSPNITVAFRASVFDASKPPIRNFIVAGYAIADRTTYEAAGQNAFVVVLRKGN